MFVSSFKVSRFPHCLKTRAPHLSGPPVQACDPWRRSLPAMCSFAAVCHRFLEAMKSTYERLFIQFSKSRKNHFKVHFSAEMRSLFLIVSVPLFDHICIKHQLSQPAKLVKACLRPWQRLVRATPNCGIHSGRPPGSHQRRDAFAARQCPGWDNKQHFCFRKNPLLE